jgi:hypothetical protein
MRWNLAKIKTAANLLGRWQRFVKLIKTELSFAQQNSHHRHTPVRMMMVEVVRFANH